MQLENQVCSLELAKKLKELGVKQESYFYHDLPSGMITHSLVSGEHYSAYTVAELGEMLPKVLQVKTGNQKTFLECSNSGKEWEVKYNDRQGGNICQIADTEADSRAKMLIYLLENKLITP